MTAFLTQTYVTHIGQAEQKRRRRCQQKTGLTQNVGEPQGEILLHGEQAGLVPTGQPVVILLHVCQAGDTRMLGAQGAAHGSLLTACGSREHTLIMEAMRLRHAVILPIPSFDLLS